MTDEAELHQPWRSQAAALCAAVDGAAKALRPEYRRRFASDALTEAEASAWAPFAQLSNDGAAMCRHVLKFVCVAGSHRNWSLSDALHVVAMRAAFYPGNAGFRHAYTALQCLMAWRHPRPELGTSLRRLSASSAGAISTFDLLYVCCAGNEISPDMLHYYLRYVPKYD